MPPAESSLCAKQQRFNSGKYYFVTEFDTNPLLVQLICLVSDSRQKSYPKRQVTVLDESSGHRRQATLFLYIKLTYYCRLRFSTINSPCYNSCFPATLKQTTRRSSEEERQSAQPVVAKRNPARRNWCQTSKATPLEACQVLVYPQQDEGRSYQLFI
jgi:hypothetical protein